MRRSGSFLPCKDWLDPEWPANQLAQVGTQEGQPDRQDQPRLLVAEPLHKLPCQSMTSRPAFSAVPAAAVRGAAESQTLTEELKIVNWPAIAHEVGLPRRHVPLFRT